MRKSRVGGGDDDKSRRHRETERPPRTRRSGSNAPRLSRRASPSPSHLDVDVSRKDGVLLVDLLNNKGSFQLILVPEKQEIHLLSPVSGPQTYGWDASANAWKHVKDDHDLTGIIVRDHIRAGCVGLPRL